MAAPRKPTPKAPKLPPGLLVEESDAVATLTLARPDRLNALTFDIYAALRDLFASYRRRPDIRAIVLTGQGRGFSSGGDVEDIIGRLLKMDKAQLRRFTRMTCDVVENMRACPQPIVAALNGVVAGAGAALAIASDIRLAVPEAKIRFLFVQAGLSGADMGAAHILPRLVGLGRATELLMLGDAITADEAHRIGLVNRIVPPERLLEEARALALRLASGPEQGIPVTKRALDAEVAMDLREALAYDVRVQTECMTHPDFLEAYHAFKERRPPRFGERARAAPDRQR